jgi:hypothetical protein
MTDEQIMQLAEQFFFCNCSVMEYSARKEDIIKFTRKIIEDAETDREHNLGLDEYFNGWRN